MVLDSLTDYVNHYAQLRPTAEAVVFESRRVAYLQLKKDVDNCARALRTLVLQHWPKELKSNDRCGFNGTKGQCPFIDP